MDLAVLQIQKNLDEIKKVATDGFEFWSARDLQEILGYAKWQKFYEVVDKAKTACDTSGRKSQDHFTHADKLVLTGSGASRKIEDFLLTRLACYLIAQNGDPRKPEISLSQIYFASQTRKQEILEHREYENKRLESRNKLKLTEKKIEGTVYERGINLPIEFATFKNRNMNEEDLKKVDLRRKKEMKDRRVVAKLEIKINKNKL